HPEESSYQSCGASLVLQKILVGTVVLSFKGSGTLYHHFCHWVHQHWYCSSVRSHFPKCIVHYWIFLMLQIRPLYCYMAHCSEALIIP
ncbi:hypothetical protein FKM82_026721, partial [Ascaphus truei]